MKIGLYFGSFNPIHIGHLILANEALNQINLDQLWLMVSPQNPLKKEATLLNANHRFHLVQIAVEEDLRLRANNFEFKLPKPSYTVHTLHYLTEKYPQHEFSILMGSDSLSNLPKWKNYEIILKNYRLIVYPRNLFPLVEYPNARIEVLKDVPFLPISSSAIRKYIKAKKSIRYMVPEKVFLEIQNQGYYSN